MKLINLNNFNFKNFKNILILLIISSFLFSLSLTTKTKTNSKSKTISFNMLSSNSNSNIKNKLKSKSNISSALKSKNKNKLQSKSNFRIKSSSNEEYEFSKFFEEAPEEKTQNAPKNQGETQKKENNAKDQNQNNKNDKTDNQKGKGKIQFLSNWLKISSKQFKNPKSHPEINSWNDERIKINSDFADFRLNDAYKRNESPQIEPKEERDFWFRLRNEQIYYSNTKDDLNILGEMRFSLMMEITSMDKGEDGFCFTVTDSSSFNEEWRLCSNEEKIRNTWVCALQKVTEKPLADYCDNSKDKPKIEIKKVIQPYVIVPIPSRKCNEDWDYQKQGDDWECDCKEGREQSPIDLPEKHVAINTSDVPNFKYHPVEKVAKKYNNEGGQTETENLKFKLEENLLRLKANFGKAVTPDGAVYFAEEIVFHTPADHQINGKTYDMEVQIIHNGKSKGDIGRQMVLSFLFEKTPGVYNKFIDDFDFFNLPNPSSPIVDIIHNLNLAKIFQNSDEEETPRFKPFSFYTYQGSLTSPPCVEDTVMYVASKPLPLSSTVLHLFTEALRMPDQQDSQGNVHVSEFLPITNRKIQPINGRPVFHFDHTILCGPDKVKKIKKLGHYEKVQTMWNQYFYVPGEQLSGVPNAFLVSENEAKGIPSDEEKNNRGLEVGK